MSEHKNDVHVSGMMKMNQDIEANDVSISGMFKVKGNVNCHTLKNSGLTSIEGNVTTEELICSGVLKVTDQIKAQLVKVSGALNACSIETEMLKVSGKMEINQTLNCEECDIHFGARSSIHDIEATKVLIKNTSNRKKLSLNSITADDIQVDHITCDVIRGDKVVIGTHSEITTIEYKTSIDIHPKAKVKHVYKL
jgi:cytoskeletal protein CcmA (bactofilin family)